MITGVALVWAISSPVQADIRKGYSLKGDPLQVEEITGELVTDGFYYTGLGKNVARRGDRMIMVGGKDFSVHIFEKVNGQWVNDAVTGRFNAWEERSDIATNYDYYEDLLYGNSVGIVGDYAAVGIPNMPDSDPAQLLSGAVKIYARNSTTGVWEEDQVILGSSITGRYDCRFGYSVAMDMTNNSTSTTVPTLAVGAFRKNVSNKTVAGTVYIYQRTGSAPSAWQLTHTWTTASPINNGFFGKALAMSGNRIAASEIGFSSKKGNVIIKTRNTDGTWPSTVETVPRPSVFQNGDGFGQTIDIDGDSLIVGHVDDVATGTSTVKKRAYVFRRESGSWVNKGEFKPMFTRYQQNPNITPAVGNDTGYGTSVSISGTEAVVSTTTGTAYVLREVNGTWKTSELLYDTGSPEPISVVDMESTSEGNEITLGYSTLNKAVIFGKNEGLPESMTTLLPASPAGNEKLGGAVSGDSHAYAATAPGELAVYLSTRRDGSWSVPQRFTGAANSNFGAAVDMDGPGNVAIVGADLADISGTDSGGASIFRKDSVTGVWSLEATMAGTGNFIKPTGHAANDRLGASVAIEGNLAVIGAWANDTGGTNRGQVHIYQFNGTNWVHQTAIGGDATNDNFGRQVAIYNGVIAIGAPGVNASPGTTDIGAIYIYTGSGASWTRQAKLTVSGANIDDVLGGSQIEMFGDYVLSGAATDTGGTNTGSLLIFKKPSTGWANGNEYQRINGTVAGGFYGANLGMDADRLIVGSMYENSSAGAIYHYAWSDTGTGISTTLLDTYDGAAAGDQLSASLSLVGGVYMFGANQTDGASLSNLGSVTIYSSSTPPPVGMVQWLDATRMAGDGPGAFYEEYTLSGALDRYGVKGWYDASLVGNHIPEDTYVTQTRASRPTYIPSEAGYHKVNFNGSQVLEASSLSLVPGSSNRTIIMIVRSSNTSSSATIVSEGDVNVSGEAFEISPQIGLKMGSTSVKAWNENFGSYYHILAVVQSSTSSTGVQAYLDGVPTTLNGTDPNTSLNVDSGFRVGASVGGANGFTGDIAELFVYNRALTKTELEEMQAYADDKWLRLKNGSTRTPAVDRPDSGLGRSGVTVFLANELKYGNVGSNPADIVYTVVSTPTNSCTLKKADSTGTTWTALAATDTFTQEDVDNRHISITHPGGGTENYVSFVYDVDSPVGAFEDQTCYITVRANRPARKTYIRTSDQKYYPKNDNLSVANREFQYMFDADIRELGRASECLIAKELTNYFPSSGHRTDMMYAQNPNIRFIFYNKATYVHDAPDVGTAELYRKEIAMTPAGDLKVPLTASSGDNVVIMHGTSANGILASTVSGTYSLPKATSKANFVYFIRIDDELMRVESVTVDTPNNEVEITVTRAFDGSTLAAHATTYTTDQGTQDELTTNTKISKPYFIPGGGPDGVTQDFIQYWITGDDGVFQYNVDLAKSLINTGVYHGVYWDNYTADPGGRWNYDNASRPFQHSEATYAVMQDNRIGYVQSNVDSYIAGMSSKPQFSVSGQTADDEIFNVVNNMHTYSYMKIYGQTSANSTSIKSRPVDYIQYENWEREDRFLSFLASEKDEIATLARTEVFGSEYDDGRYNKELYCYGWYLLCKNPDSNSLFGMYGRRPNSWDVNTLNRTITVHNQVYVNLGSDVSNPSTPPENLGELLDLYEVTKEGSPVVASKLLAREYANAIVVVNRSSRTIQNIPLDDISGSYSGPYIDAVTGKGQLQQINLKAYSSMILLKP